MTDTIMKTCTKCGVAKGFAEFHRDAKGKHGLMSMCKVCNSAKASAWKKQNRDRANESSKTWSRENKEARNAIVRKSRAKHADARRSMERKRAAKLRLESAEYREKNKLRCKEWYEANRSRALEQMASRYAEKRDLLLAKMRTYYKARGGEIAKIRREKLVDSYVFNSLGIRGVNADAVPQTLIDLQRARLLVHRAIRKGKQA